MMPPMSRDLIECRAVSLLQELQPTALIGSEPTDIEKIFEFYVPDRYGIETGYTDLSGLGSGILGYTDAMQKVSFVDSTLSDSRNLPTQRRFRATVGHECFHCMKHVSVLNRFSSLCRGDLHSDLFRRERTEIKPYNDPEWQAWEYSMSILMPKNVIIKYLNSGYGIEDFAEIFDVNPAFVRVRLSKLKIKTP